MFLVLVPLFWVPVHGLRSFFKKIGIFTYVVPFITWLPVAYIIYMQREVILRFSLDMPSAVRIAGTTIFFLGLLLQIWTLKLLRLWGLIGLPEVTSVVKSRIVTGGPFSIVRHPTYLSHTIMYVGVFLFTGVIAVGLAALLDLLIINILVIPLEDRELTERFGSEYRQYRNKVPAFFPWVWRRHG